MKNFRRIGLTVTACVFLTACNLSGSDNNTNNNNPTETAEATPTPTPKPSPNVNMIISNNPESSEPVEVAYPDSGYVFALTDEEKAVYEKLKTELSTDVFEGLSPYSVAKIYVQCGIDGQWEAEYVCHSKEGLEKTLADWEAMNQTDASAWAISGRQEYANWIFPLIEEGEFVEDGNKGVIKFHQIPDIDVEEMTDEEIKEYMELYYEEDTYAEFHLIKNDKGIWEVRYRPHAID